ncbi:sensor histidine kinase [Thermorudis peleae]|uniref:sensor histidine kinase n=1 Tax=Thermorudis peleae TaxID=1382356 RepID=UPI0006919490|nr:HAMP domain-containing sensor histidine kinase [Thermorudis peleae]
MLRSVRARIFVGCIGVVLVMVLTTAMAASVPIRHFQRQLAVERLQTLAVPLATGVTSLGERPGATAATIQTYLTQQAERLQARLLIFDSQGTLLMDSAPNTPLPPSMVSALQQRMRDNADTLLAITRPPNRPMAINGGVIDQQQVIFAPIPRSGGAVLVLLTSLSPAPIARSLLFPLSLSLLLGLIAAGGATWFISRAIAGPIERLTRAADVVAAGQLNVVLHEEGPDEVGRLVRSFNAMVRSLRATFESQRQLLANIAHELRTPLTVIQGYALALREQTFDDPQEELQALEIINDESERMSRLLTQLLQLSRLETGQRQPALVPVALADLVQRAFQRHRLAAEQNGIHLENAVDANFELAVDPDLFTQLFDNLLTNALRHCQTGAVIRIAAERSIDPVTHQPIARITVSDTGSGIPPEALPHLFDRFYRVPAERAAAETESGFGLGLAIVREIVTAHGGTITVESQLGKGTTFTITLPVQSNLRSVSAELARKEGI